MMNELKAGLRYRMPVGFGPAPSPRQRSDGKPWANTMVSRIESTAVSFLTDVIYLQRLLPPGIELDGDPVITVEMKFLTELEWLAGRGYNTLGVRFPAKYAAKDGVVRGPFLSILWENKADPIISGREELGFAKLFCDLPPVRKLDGRRHYEASWEAHRFMEMIVSDLKPALPSPQVSHGTLHYRYMPRVGVPGIADSQGVVITPPPPTVELVSHFEGRGRAQFLMSTWEQLPTLFHIVNALAELPVIEERPATVSTLRYDTAWHNQHALC